MATVLERAALLARLEGRERAIIDAMADGFAALARGEVVVPPVGHLDFKEAERLVGDCHIKYGYVRGRERFVIKIATGFYDNPKLGLPSGDGAVLVFSQKTGALEAILLDGGELTNLRTAAAGALAAQLLAPREVAAIGIAGTGVQARLQAAFLREVTPCRRLVLWGRTGGAVASCRADLVALGFEVETASTPRDLARATIIVTTTPAQSPIVHGEWLRPGTHVTAVGADGGGKRELDADVFRRVDVAVVDRLEQCEKYGDVSYALAEGAIARETLVELGELVRDPTRGRKSETAITVADLTGVAVQDIAIADLVLSGT
jgi:ornithine cyclodeaminase